MARSFVTRALAPAWVQAEHLNVAPELLGAPLAPHGRRLAAILVDAALIGVLSSTGMFWSVAGVGALAIQLRRRTPRRPAWRSVLMWLAIAWLSVVAFAQGAGWLAHHADRASVVAALRGDEVDDEDAEPVAAPASAASGSDAARIRSLEAQLAQAREPRPLQWRDAAVRRLHRLGLSFGWAIAYFTLLPTWWKGQTVGKRLLGLRVVELTGKPLGLMTCFGRYGGYAAGLATGGVGLLQVLWDPNRQAVQDKLAHTVVVDLRATHAPAPSSRLTGPRAPENPTLRA